MIREDGIRAGRSLCPYSGAKEDNFHFKIHILAQILRYNLSSLTKQNKARNVPRTLTQWSFLVSLNIEN